MFNMPGSTEMLVILGIALLVFGKNLPQVGRSIGTSIVEFKKGLKGIQEEVDQADKEADRQIAKSKDKDKFT